MAREVKQRRHRGRTTISSRHHEALNAVVLLGTDDAELQALAAQAREVLGRVGATPFMERLDLAIAGPPVAAAAGRRATKPEAVGDTYLAYLAAKWKIPRGSCADGSTGTERWRGSRGTGIVACMNPYEGRPWIYFSFGDGKYLGFATRDDADHDALYAWWEQLTTFLP